MDFAKLIDDSFKYTKDGLIKNLSTWIILIILALLPIIPFILAFISILPSLLSGNIPDISVLIGGIIVAFILAILLSTFYMGYIIRIYRGEDPLPEVSVFSELFLDGLKYIVIGIIYSIPVLIVYLLLMGAASLAILSSTPNMNNIFALFGSIILGIIIALIIGFILMLFSTIGIIRFSRTKRVGEAFNFSAILSKIRSIGWGSYILALIILLVIVIVVEIILSVIPFIGPILQIIFAPAISIFAARYICLLYDYGIESQTVASP